MQSILSKVADKLFELFIVNPNVAAVQAQNGNYYTKYFSYNSDVLEKMLEKNGSMGCYQQGYRSGMVRWICLDFDCRDKEDADIKWLYEQAVIPCTEYLKEIGINYLTEYSGRRGIHVWVIFNTLLEKKYAFYIIEAILNNIEYTEEVKGKFAIDRFPATWISAGNKVGKQVKIPLSVHQKGIRSFFFIESPDINILEHENFWQMQLDILDTYVMNDVVECMDKLQIKISEEHEPQYIYHSYEILQGVECSAEQVISILSETRVYNNIFDRLYKGQKENRDWFVLLGTLKYLSNSEQLLNDIFCISPYYQKSLTMEQIEQWKDSYYPATFGYLYNIYQLEMERELNENETGLVYLLHRLGVNEQIIREQKFSCMNEKSSFSSAAAIRLKELNYIHDNDEVVTISYLNRLNYLTGYDLDKLDLMVQEIKNGNRKSLDVCDVMVYERKEEDKIRKLVSLGAEERILTTCLALILAYDLKNGWKSYSYNILYSSRTDIFYNWYSSWENFLDSIKAYLEVPYFEDYGFMELDVKSFYDSVDFLSVCQLIEGTLSEADSNILNCLIDYNDKLMRYINNGSRIGVPQGPAYARIIAEYYMNIIIGHMEKFCPELKNGVYHFSRYVDDMFLVYDENIDGELLYSQMNRLVEKYGLRLNREKSINHGRIGEIREEVRKKILRKDKSHYEFKEDDYNWSLSLFGKQKRFQQTAFSEKYSIDDVTYVFGKRCNLYYKQLYYNKYAEKIFEENGGRGSAFIRFYSFLFQNPQYLQDAINRKLFNRIPLNSLNFKNCVSQMYLGKQSSSLTIKGFALYDILKEWSSQKIDEEDACIVNALLHEEDRRKNGRNGKQD